MKLVFVNIMQELQRFDSTAYITQPPVPLAVLNAATPGAIETGLIDEQADQVRFAGDVFAFSVSTENARAAYGHADALRAAGKIVIMGGIHATTCAEEVQRHADAIVTGEAETIWPEVCEDLLAGKLKAKYIGSPTPPSRMTPVDYRFFGRRKYLTPASLFATRGCNRRCSFCVSSRYMGAYRMKPLAVLEREIDQLNTLYPGSFLQFTDDNLLVNRDYRQELLAILRGKQCRFVTMVTVDQFCDDELIEQMASSGCLGVAVGVESVDDDNCAAVSKYQNLRQPFVKALAHANRCGIQVVPLIMVGLPHDTPERLEHALQFLKRIPCSIYDVRILRIYPSTSLYREKVAAGEVTPEWWLQANAPETCNHLLPSSLAMNFKHPQFGPTQLQTMALRFLSELNQLTPESIAHVMRVGTAGGGLRLAGTLLYARRRCVSQARQLLKQVEAAAQSNRGGT